MTSSLALDDVSVTRGNSLVLDGATLHVGEGEVVALLGPSGSGKSTLLRVLLGLEVPSRGVVKLGGRTVSEAGRVRLPPEERDLAVVFQDLALWPHLTVAGNLAFVLRSKGRFRGEERDRIHQMLDQVGLADFEDRYPGELSGGEQQRVAIARALVTDPAAVLLDEPLANLDIALKQDLIALLIELFRERGSTVLHVTHDPREAAALTERVAILEEGRITYTGRLDELPDAGSTFTRAVRGAAGGRG
ncbi:MAG: ABC transporter ATP-binding protein [Deltaproteobacteria bacterium]|nr:MAG: ABC transporter ATP-binding protein [Deltaproteobacteria bacterium]